MGNRSALIGCITVVLVPLVVIFLVIAFFSIKTVSPGQVATVTRFGILDKEVRKEGVYLALFEGYTYYNLKSRTIESTETAGSQDAQNVSVRTAFIYSLQSDKVSDLYKNVGSQEELENNRIRPVISQAIKEATARFKAEELLPRQAEFKAIALELVKTQLNSEYISIQDVVIVDVDFSEQYNAAIEAKQVSEQRARQQEFELERERIIVEQQKLQQQTLTPEILRARFIDKWNGVLPQTLTGDQLNLLLGIK